MSVIVLDNLHVRVAGRTIRAGLTCSVDGSALGLLGPTEALTYLPQDWPDRGPVLNNFRRHTRALLRHQAPDGMWRQVVDEPGSYREVTVTAMTIVALARGVRLGWLGETYRPAIERAWLGLAASANGPGMLYDEVLRRSGVKVSEAGAAMEMDELRGQR